MALLLFIISLRYLQEVSKHSSPAEEGVQTRTLLIKDAAHKKMTTDHGKRKVPTKIKDKWELKNNI